MGAGAVGGLFAAAAMAGAAGRWAVLFSKDKKILEDARRGMLVMAAVEVVNFPLAVSGGIVRGTALPWLGTWASIGGFYLVALPLAVLMGFKEELGLAGMLLGFLVGGATSGALLLVFLARMDWGREVVKAQRLAGSGGVGGHELDVMQSRNRTGCTRDNFLFNVDEIDS
ncbi:hypothetical protein HPP92_026373 [Vanilla planifolia]|uniref:Uncharacterized protein n=1 Tax=Vanilla planifolia TaxID=51239 RepID=A0A835PG63_VANPL|nr:hypothetical protein HPP92_026373 [Vanilla planifolia]